MSTGSHAVAECDAAGHDGSASSSSSSSARGVVLPLDLNHRRTTSLGDDPLEELVAALIEQQQPPTTPARDRDRDRDRDPPLELPVEHSPVILEEQPVESRQHSNNIVHEESPSPFVKEEEGKDEEGSGDEGVEFEEDTIFSTRATTAAKTDTMTLIAADTAEVEHPHDSSSSLINEEKKEDSENHPIHDLDHCDEKTTLNGDWSNGTPAITITTRVARIQEEEIDADDAAAEEVGEEQNSNGNSAIVGDPPPRVAVDPEMAEKDHDSFAVPPNEDTAEEDDESVTEEPQCSELPHEQQQHPQLLQIDTATATATISTATTATSSSSTTTPTSASTIPLSIHKTDTGDEQPPKMIQQMLQQQQQQQQHPNEMDSQDSASSNSPSPTTCTQFEDDETPPPLDEGKVLHDTSDPSQHLLRVEEVDAEQVETVKEEEPNEHYNACESESTSAIESQKILDSATTVTSTIPASESLLDSSSYSSLNNVQVLLSLSIEPETSASSAISCANNETAAQEEEYEKEIVLDSATTSTSTIPASESLLDSSSYSSLNNVQVLQTLSIEPETSSSSAISCANNETAVQEEEYEKEIVLDSATTSTSTIPASESLLDSSSYSSLNNVQVLQVLTIEPEPSSSSAISSANTETAAQVDEQRKKILLDATTVTPSIPTDSTTTTTTTSSTEADEVDASPVSHTAATLLSESENPNSTVSTTLTIPVPPPELEPPTQGSTIFRFFRGLKRSNSRTGMDGTDDASSSSQKISLVRSIFPISTTTTTTTTKTEEEGRSSLKKTKFDHHPDDTIQESDETLRMMDQNGANLKYLPSLMAAGETKHLGPEEGRIDTEGENHGNEDCAKDEIMSQLLPVMAGVDAKSHDQEDLAESDSEEEEESQEIAAANDDTSAFDRIRQNDDLMMDPSDERTLAKKGENSSDGTTERPENEPLVSPVDSSASNTQVVPDLKPPQAQRSIYSISRGFSSYSSSVMLASETKHPLEEDRVDTEEKNNGSEDDEKDESCIKRTHDSLSSLDDEEQLLPVAGIDAASHVNNFMDPYFQTATQEDIVEGEEESQEIAAEVAMSTSELIRQNDDLMMDPSDERTLLLLLSAEKCENSSGNAVERPKNGLVDTTVGTSASTIDIAPDLKPPQPERSIYSFFRGLKRPTHSNGKGIGSDKTSYASNAHSIDVGSASVSKLQEPKVNITDHSGASLNYSSSFTIMLTGEAKHPEEDRIETEGENYGDGDEDNGESRRKKTPASVSSNDNVELTSQLFPATGLNAESHVNSHSLSTTTQATTQATTQEDLGEGDEEKKESQELAAANASMIISELIRENNDLMMDPSDERTLLLLLSAEKSKNSSDITVDVERQENRSLDSTVEDSASITHDMPDLKPPQPQRSIYSFFRGLKKPNQSNSSGDDNSSYASNAHSVRAEFNGAGGSSSSSNQSAEPLLRSETSVDGGGIDEENWSIRGEGERQSCHENCEKQANDGRTITREPLVDTDRHQASTTEIPVSTAEVIDGEDEELQKLCDNATIEPDTLSGSAEEWQVGNEIVGVMASASTISLPAPIVSETPSPLLATAASEPKPIARTSIFRFFRGLNKAKNQDIEDATGTNEEQSDSPSRKNSDPITSPEATDCADRQGTGAAPSDIQALDFSDTYQTEIYEAFSASLSGGLQSRGEDDVDPIIEIVSSQMIEDGIALYDQAELASTTMESEDTLKEDMIDSGASFFCQEENPTESCSLEIEGPIPVIEALQQSNVNEFDSTDSYDRARKFSASALATSKVLVLVSCQSKKRQVMLNQQLAFSILQSAGLSYDVLDGSQPLNLQRRTELFEVSGRIGQYPQIFKITHSDDNPPLITFYGDVNKIKSANDLRTLVQDLSSEDIQRTDFGATSFSSEIASMTDGIIISSSLDLNNKLSSDRSSDMKLSIGVDGLSDTACDTPNQPAQAKTSMVVPIQTTEIDLAAARLSSSIEYPTSVSPTLAKKEMVRPCPAAFKLLPSTAGTDQSLPVVTKKAALPVVPVVLRGPTKIVHDTDQQQSSASSPIPFEKPLESSSNTSVDQAPPNGAVPQSACQGSVQHEKVEDAGTVNSEVKTVLVKPKKVIIPAAFGSLTSNVVVPKAMPPPMRSYVKSIARISAPSPHVANPNTPSICPKAVSDTISVQEGSHRAEAIMTKNKKIKAFLWFNPSGGGNKGITVEVSSQNDSLSIDPMQQPSIYPSTKKLAIPAVFGTGSTKASTPKMLNKSSQSRSINVPNSVPDVIDVGLSQPAEGNKTCSLELSTTPELNSSSHTELKRVSPFGRSVDAPTTASASTKKLVIPAAFGRKNRESIATDSQPSKASQPSSASQQPHLPWKSKSRSDSLDFRRNFSNEKRKTEGSEEGSSSLHIVTDAIPPPPPPPPPVTTVLDNKAPSGSKKLVIPVVFGPAKSSDTVPISTRPSQQAKAQQAKSTLSPVSTKIPSPTSPNVPLKSNSSKLLINPWASVSLSPVAKRPLSSGSVHDNKCTLSSVPPSSPSLSISSYQNPPVSGNEVSEEQFHQQRKPRRITARRVDASTSAPSSSLSNGRYAFVPVAADESEVVISAPSTPTPTAATKSTTVARYLSRLVDPASHAETSTTTSPTLAAAISTATTTKTPKSNIVSNSSSVLRMARRINEEDRAMLRIPTMAAATTSTAVVATTKPYSKVANTTTTIAKANHSTEKTTVGATKKMPSSALTKMKTSSSKATGSSLPAKAWVPVVALSTSLSSCSSASSPPPPPEEAAPPPLLQSSSSSLSRKKKQTTTTTKVNIPAAFLKG